MKKNGFTLIEILVVIALLTAISVTVGVSMQGSQEREKEKEINYFIETVENAACLYAEKYNILDNGEVSLEKLIEEGVLRKDLVNPKTEKKISEELHDDEGNDIMVSIKWENNEKVCEFNIND